MNAPQTPRETLNDCAVSTLAQIEEMKHVCNDTDDVGSITGIWEESDLIQEQFWAVLQQFRTRAYRATRRAKAYKRKMAQDTNSAKGGAA